MDFWRSYEQRNGTESTFEVRKNIGNSILIVDLDKIDVLMDAVVEAADIDEICGFWFVAFEFGDFACSWCEEGLLLVEEAMHEDVVDF